MGKDQDLPPQAGEKFTILRELGRGGMGAVYEAKDNELGRHVALKFLHGQTLARLERFRVESETLARLRHPNIVQVHECGEAEGGVFLVLDFVDGESLEQRVERGPLEPKEAVRIARDVAAALQHCHDHGVIHRDVKPGNVLLEQSGRVLLTDFGIARDLEREVALSKTGAMIGTPAYMPPEQARGQKDAIDARSDVYALGATLYEMLTGKGPFAGYTLPARLAAGDLTLARADLHPDLVAICTKCLRSKASLRYPTAQALGDDLDRHLRGEPVEARSRRVGPVLLLSLALIAVALAMVAASLIATRGKSHVAGTPSGPTPTATSPKRSPPVSRFAPLKRDPLRLTLPGLLGARFAGPEHVLAWSASEWCVWRLADREISAQGRVKELQAAAVDAKGELLLLAQPKRVSLQRLAGGGAIASVPLVTEEVALSPTGEVAALVAGVTVVLWRPGRAVAVEMLYEAKSEPRALVFSPDGSYLAFASGGTNRDADPRELVVWTSAGELVARWEIPRPAYQLAFAPNTGLLATGDDWGGLRIYDPATPGAAPISFTAPQPGPLGGAHTGEVAGVVFDPHGVLLSVSGHSPQRAAVLTNELRRWEISDGVGRLLSTHLPLADEYVALDVARGRALLLTGAKAKGEVRITSLEKLR